MTSDVVVGGDGATAGGDVECWVEVPRRFLVPSLPMLKPPVYSDDESEYEVGNQSEENPVKPIAMETDTAVVAEAVVYGLKRVVMRVAAARELALNEKLIINVS